MNLATLRKSLIANKSAAELFIECSVKLGEIDLSRGELLIHRPDRRLP